MNNDWGFDLIKLRQICNMDVKDFMDGRYGEVYGPETEDEDQDVLAGKGYKNNWQYDLDGRHCFKDNGANILAVAHVDTVAFSNLFTWNGANRVGSGQFDDRVGVYVITELLPSLGVQCDILLCTDEESGATTASDFYTDKQYNWIFEFDRREDDIVLYQYWGKEWEEALKSVGFKIGSGSYSDISQLAHLEAKAVNIGVAYDSNYHSTACTVNLIMLRNQINKFLEFYNKYKDKHFHHNPNQERYSSTKYTYKSGGSHYVLGNRDDWYDYGDYADSEDWRKNFKSSKTAVHKPEDKHVLDPNFLYNRSHNRRWDVTTGTEDMDWFYSKRNYYTKAQATANEATLIKGDKRYFIDLRFEPIAPINLWENYNDIDSNYDDFIDWELRDKATQLAVNENACPVCGREDCYGEIECGYCRNLTHDDEFCAFMGMCEPCAKACGYDYEDLDNYRDAPVDEAWDN